MTPKRGMRRVPLVVRLPDGSAFKILITPAAFRAMYADLFRQTLGRVHVSESYSSAIRVCMRGRARSMSKWAMVQALPRAYRRAMLLAVIEAWWSCKNEYSEVMHKRTLAKPRCLLPKRFRLDARTIGA